MAVLLENFINHTLKVEEDEKKKIQAEQRSRAEVLSDEEGADVQREKVLTVMGAAAAQPNNMLMRVLRRSESGAG